MSKRKKVEPIITYAEILSMAGQHIQAEIIKLRREGTDLYKGLMEAGRHDKTRRVNQMTETQTAYLLERLKAIETMYKIETGEELDLLTELEYPVESHVAEDAKAIIERFGKRQTKAPYPCPRCGRILMDDDPLRNALSRRAHVYVCDPCGSYEAIEDVSGDKLSLDEWAIIQHPDAFCITEDNEREE